jgi:pilus assembly protein CpaF
MFSVVIQEKGGKSQKLQFNKNEITVGRVQGNDIVLPKGNVSKRHSKIVLKEGKFIIVDLKSTNGTYVNGHKISSPQVIKNTDKVYVGDFILSIEEGGGDGAALGGPSAPPPMPGPPGPPMGGPGGPPGPPGPPMGGPGGPPGPGGPGGPPGPGGPGGPPQPPPLGQQTPGPGGPPPMGGRPPAPTGPPPMGGPRPGTPGPPGPGTPPPMMGGQQGPPRSPGPPPMGGPQGGAKSGSWNEVSVNGGPSYHYLAVKGGWLVSGPAGMAFISDPNHSTPPVPA